MSHVRYFLLLCSFSDCTIRYEWNQPDKRFHAFLVTHLVCPIIQAVQTSKHYINPNTPMKILTYFAGGCNVFRCLGVQWCSCNLAKTCPYPCTNRCLMKTLWQKTWRIQQLTRRHEERPLTVSAVSVRTPAYSRDSQSVASSASWRGVRPGRGGGQQED